MRLEGFDLEERRVAYGLSECFYVTKSGKVEIGNAAYHYLTVRPADSLSHALPHAREIVLLLSPYDNFEARTLDAYHHIVSQYEDHRINGQFRLLCSRDPDIRQKLQKLFVEEPDIPVTIPFLYEDLTKHNVTNSVINAVRQGYHFRDLFAQKSPLQNDTYFFGRSSVISRLRDRMQHADNSGVFGLRKSGKTSVILALQRAATADGYRFSFIDCQNPSINTRPWFDVLRYIAIDLRSKAGLSTTNNALGEFSEISSASDFERTILDVYSRGKRLSVVAFDEIEHVSPVSGSAQWRGGENALKLWQTIRSIQQRHPGRLCIIVAGTNPTVTEARDIAGADNPLLEYIHAEYLGGLADSDIHRMCTDLGGLMGIDFELSALHYIYSQIGGQPYLTRQICSSVHRRLPLDGRPLAISEIDIRQSFDSFDFGPLLDDVLASLKERYPDEYSCLQWIALGDHAAAQEFIDADPKFLKHLEGYGIIEIKAGKIRPRLEILLNHLRSRAKPSQLIRGEEDRWAKMAARRGRVEKKMRELLRGRLIDIHGKANAADGLRMVLSKIRAESLKTFSLDEIFSEESSRLYWTDLIQAVKVDQEYWERRLGAKSEIISMHLNRVNDGRQDAHAKNISDRDFDDLLMTLNWFDEAF